MALLPVERTGSGWSDKNVLGMDEPGSHSGGGAGQGLPETSRCQYREAVGWHPSGAVQRGIILERRLNMLISR